MPRTTDSVVAGDEHVRVADVAGKQRAGLVGHLPRDRERLPVHRLEQVLLADRLQLLAVRVVRERLDDVGSRVDELPMKLRDELGVLEDDLGDERPGLQVAPPLELEEVALGTDDGALVEPLQQTCPGTGTAHAASLSSLHGGRRRPHRAQGRPDGVTGSKLRASSASALRSRQATRVGSRRVLREPRSWTASTREQRGAQWLLGPVVGPRSAALELLGDAIRSAGRPVLGICAGMQLQAVFAGGTIGPSRTGEHGYLPIRVHDRSELLRDLPREAVVFQDHDDEVVRPPGRNSACSRRVRPVRVQAIADPERRWWGTQFHPEEYRPDDAAGKQVLRTFFALAA